MTKYIILHLCPGPEPSWWGDDDKPVLFDTHKEATDKMNEDFYDLVAQQQDEVEKGFRDADEVDEECDEWVVECEVDQNGVITTKEDGIIYDPATWVR